LVDDDILLLILLDDDPEARRERESERDTERKRSTPAASIPPPPPPILVRSLPRREPLLDDESLLPKDGGADAARFSLASSFTAAADDVPIIPPSLPVRVVGAFIRFFRPLTKEVVVVVVPTNDDDNDTDATLLERPLMMLSFSRFSSSTLSLASSLFDRRSLVLPGVMVTPPTTTININPV
jgi:hypothetical protein